jgi:hypothetical protein
MIVPVTATPGGFQFVCPYCRRLVVDTGIYAETACLHEFEVVILGVHRIAVFAEPVRQQIAA